MGLPSHSYGMSLTIWDHTRDYIDKLISRYRSPTTHHCDILWQTAHTISCGCHQTFSNGWQEHAVQWDRSPRTRPWVRRGSAGMQVAGWQFRHLPRSSRLCVVRGGGGLVERPTTQHVNEIQYLHASQSLSRCWCWVCVLLALCYRCCLTASHDPRHCRPAVVSSFSTTAVKSRHSSSGHPLPPDLPLTPACLPAPSTISRYCDMNCYDNRYEFFVMI